MSSQDLLTTAEVAHAMRATTQTVRNWIEDGRLEAVRVGRRYLIPRSELARLEIQEVPAGEVPWDHTQAAVPLTRGSAGWVNDGP
jgi:excisionase family DNA binding protein